MNETAEPRSGTRRPLRSRVFKEGCLSAFLRWTAPLVIFVFAAGAPDGILFRLIGAVIAACAVGVLIKRPWVALLVLCIGFPVAELVLPLIYRFGFPAAAVRTLGLWKEGLVAVLVVAAVQHRQRHPARADGIDLLCIAFVALATLYFLFPGIFPPDAIAVPGVARGPAFRSIVLPVAALVAIRHIPWTDEHRRLAARWSIAAGLLLGGCAVFEILFPSLWNTVLIDVLQLPRYRLDIFQQLGSTSDLLLHGDPTQTGSTIQRAGSIYNNQLNAAFAMLMPLSLALGTLLRDRRAATAAVVGVIAAGLVLTQTRSAMLAAGFMGIALLRPARGRTEANRAGVGMLVALVGLAVLPLVAGTTVANRVTGSVTGEDVESTPVHLERTTAAIERVIDEPLGIGIGSTGGGSIRFGVQQGVVTENHFLAVALEIGALGGVLFAAIVITCARAARRRSDDDPQAAPISSGLTAVAITGLFLHAFESVTVAVPVFVMVGLAVPVAHRELTRRAPAPLLAR